MQNYQETLSREDMQYMLEELWNKQLLQSRAELNTSLYLHTKKTSETTGHGCLGRMT